MGFFDDGLKDGAEPKAKPKYRDRHYVAGFAAGQQQAQTADADTRSRAAEESRRS